MTDKMMDELFRDKLERHASDVPSGAFERIMAARDRKKRRPAGYWYLLPAAVLLGTGVFLGIRHQNNSVAPNSQKALAEQDDNVSPVLKAAPTTAPDDGHVQDAPDVETSLTKPSAAEKNYTLADFSTAKNKRRNTGLTKDAMKSTAKQHASKPSAITDQDDMSDGKGVTTSANETSLIKNLSFPSLRTALNKSKSPLLPYQTDMASTQKFCIPPCGIPGCPDFREVRNDWYVEAFGSADMPFKSLQDTRDKTGFVPHKDSTESMLLSYSAGLRVSKNLTNNLLLKTGFHYSQINERFDYKNESERKIVTVITIRTVIRGPGDTLLVRDTSQVETVGVRVKRTYNKYRNIDIPIILSWELRKPDFTIGLNGGLLFNIRSTFQGDMLDTSLVPMSQTVKTPGSQIRTNWGLGLYAGVSFMKPIGPNTDLFAEPWYRVYLKNVATEDAPFQQKMSAWGLQLGVRYRFNGGGQR